MKAMGESRIIQILCILLFIYELSTFFETGIKVMLPNYVYGGSGEVGLLEELVNDQADYFLPVYVYSEENHVQEQRKDVFRIKTLERGEMLTLMDLENSSLGHEVTGSEAETAYGNNPVQGENQDSAVSGEQGQSSSYLDGMLQENRLAVNGENTDSGNGGAGGSGTGSASAGNAGAGGTGTGSAGAGNAGAGGTGAASEGTGSGEAGTPGGENANMGGSGTTSGFVRHEKISPVELSELSDYETLVKRFYTIDAITTIGADELNAEKLGTMDMTMKQTSDAPQILIYHTHSQEGYADSVAGDDSTTIIGVGERLKEILEQQYGYNVLHHTGKYDVETRDSAYSKSLPAIKKVLEENPSIEVVIDLHRDAVADESTRLVTDVDGRPTAKFMFFNGISRTRSTGKIDYLYNENLEANLAFSFQMKWKAEEYYPGLTRRNYLNGYRYNMHLCPKTLLIELGAQNNTLEEAMNACDPIAHLLHIVLTGE